MKASRTQSNTSPSSKVIFSAEDLSKRKKENKKNSPSVHSILKLTSNATKDTTYMGHIEPKVQLIKVISDDDIPISVAAPRTPRIYIDHLDWSSHPSYTNFKLPYEVVCRLRYQATVKKYNRQFRHELEMLEVMQPSAYEALRLNRIFSITTLWPPLHTKKEIDYVLNNFYKVPPKQQARINYLLKEEQV